MVNTIKSAAVTVQTLDNGGRIYIEAQDEQSVRYPSVTTIRNATASEKERKRLHQWQQKMDRKHGKGASRQKRNDRAQEGITVHELIEQFMKGERTEFPDSKYTTPSKGMIKYLRQSAIAVELYNSHPHPQGYAGTLDLIAHFEDQLTVFDWTTSERLKREEWMGNKFLQATAYGLAYGKRFGETPTQVGAIVLTPQRMQLFTKPLEEFTAEWWERLNRFYKDELWKDLGLNLDLI